MIRLSRVVPVVLALLVVGTACSSDQGEELTIAHVHGLGVTSETLFVATHHGLYAYEEGTWSLRSPDGADHMGFSLVTGRLMFRSGHPESGGNLGVQRSTDGGRTWRTVSTVLDSPVDFHAMAASRPDPVAIYGWSQGLFRSIGDPEEWEPVQAFGLPAQVGALAVDGDGRIYASTAAGVVRSPAGGERWQAMSSELVFALASGGNDLYASRAQGPGVLRSSDGGTSWDDVSEGLGASIIVALAASPDGRTVVAADQEAGIWRSDNRGDGWTRVPTP